MEGLLSTAPTPSSLSFDYVLYCVFCDKKDCETFPRPYQCYESKVSRQTFASGTVCQIGPAAIVCSNVFFFVIDKQLSN